MGILLNLAIVDAVKKEEKLKNQFSETDFYTPNESIKIVQDIMKRYKIDFDKEALSTNTELIKSFLNMDNNAFYTFKNDSDITRTLIKNNFKEKRKSRF